METRHRLPRVSPIRGRMDHILQRAKGQRVLHIGCVDSGLLDDRLNSGEHLHARMVDVTKGLVGVDIDAVGIEDLGARGFRDLVVADITSDDWFRALPREDFDLVVVSEVLEHLTDPGTFLRSLHSLRLSDDAFLLLTVPSPFSLDVLHALLHNEEYVHPDHVAWYSFHTLTRLLTTCGLPPVRILPYSFESTSLLPQRRRGNARQTSSVCSPHSRERGLASLRARLKILVRRLLVRLLLSRSPWWADGLIAEVKWSGARIPRQ